MSKNPRKQRTLNSWVMKMKIAEFLQNYAAICFCLFEKFINFRGEERYHQNSSIRWQRNSSIILIRILIGSFRGKFIRWICNSSRILIRILVWKCSCLFFDQNSSQKQICNFNVSWFYVVFLIEFGNDRIWYNW